MDEARTIRFYLPAVLFLLSLIWGAWVNYRIQCQEIIEHLKVDNLSSLVGLVAGGGFVVFAFGYIIGTLTYAILRAVFFVFRPRGFRYHEAAFSPEALQGIRLTMRYPDPIQAGQEISAVVVFDHGLIRERHKGVHEWLMRRWSAFAIAVNSVTGLALSLVVGHWVFDSSWSCEWLLPVGSLMAVCFYVACCAWADGRRMGAFLAQMPDAYWNKSVDT